MTYRLFMGALLGLALAGCGSSSNSGAPPADFSGVYSVAITNGQNGCGFANWTVGKKSNGTPVTITQSGASASADVGGVARIDYDVLLGSHVFPGTVSGTGMAATIHGTTSFKKGTNCTYQVTANLAATLSGNSISGNVNYTTTTNGGSDCGTLNGCASTQSFAGSRPPK